MMSTCSVSSSVVDRPSSGLSRPANRHAGLFAGRAGRSGLRREGTCSANGYTTLIVAYGPRPGYRDHSAAAYWPGWRMERPPSWFPQWRRPCAAPRIAADLCRIRKRRAPGGHHVRLRSRTPPCRPRVADVSASPRQRPETARRRTPSPAVVGAEADGDPPAARDAPPGSVSRTCPTV